MILPASCATVLAEAVNPALALLPPKMQSDAARCQMLGDGLYESGYVTRQQIGGPAHGLWQFEPNGIRAVMHNNATGNEVLIACQKCGVRFGSTMIYFAIASGEHDVLAAVLARLILWACPKPLPRIGDAQGAWDYHDITYRPGAKDPARYVAGYPQAVEALA